MSSPFVRLMSSLRCLHHLLWWFFFFLWISCWSSLQNSTSSPFLQDSSRTCPCSFHSSMLISSPHWWLTVALFLWSCTVYWWIFCVVTGSQSPFSAVFYENCSVFSGHPLAHPRFRCFTARHFSLVSRTAGFWLSVSFFNSFPRFCHSLKGQ